MVAWIQRARLAANEEPAETSRSRLDKIPRVDCIKKSFPAKKSAVILPVTSCVNVWSPRKAPEVQDCEKSHFDANQKIRQGVVPVLQGNFCGRFDEARGRKPVDDGLHVSAGLVDVDVSGKRRDCKAHRLPK